VPTRIVGAMEMIDGGETDTKLIGVIACDPRWAHVKTLDDLSQHDLKVIKDFFETYKRLQNKTVQVNEFRDTEWAINDYNTCVELMNKYGSMDKEAFIAQMKLEHPEKYK
jgi:inorganic pyrophosphatase